MKLLGKQFLQNTLPNVLASSIRHLERCLRKRRVTAVCSPLPYVMPSSTSPDYSEHSDSSEQPTDFSVETTLRVIPSSQPVVNNQLPSAEQPFLPEPASIADRILAF